MVVREAELESSGPRVDGYFTVVAKELEGFFFNGLITGFGALGDGDEGISLQGFGQSWWIRI